MGVLLVIAVLVIAYLLSKLSYKNHCINDNEAVLRMHLEEFVGVLNELQRYQNFESASRDTLTRRFINECIERYSKEARNLRKLSTSDQTVNR